MIFQQYRGQLLVVRQPDHGVQTGLFAQRWGERADAAVHPPGARDCGRHAP